jgi:hypothetical protein
LTTGFRPSETIAIELDLVGLERASGPSDEILELRQRCASVKASILEQLAAPLTCARVH